MDRTDIHLAGSGASARRAWRAWVACGLVAAAIGMLPRAVRAEGTVSTNSTTALLQALLGGGLVQLTFAETLTPEIPLLIAADTVLEGAVAGGRLATLSGGGTRRLFHVLPGIRFEIRNCVLREGASTNGGGILNEGILVASNVVFASCKATGRDGAVGKSGENRFGVGGNGGGGEAGLPARGGAIHNLGEASLVDCIFTGNAVQGGKGGDGGDGGTGTWANGIGGDGAPGATAYGGAIQGTAESRMAVTNTLFVNNTAKGGDGGAGGSDSSVLGSGHGAPGASAAGGAIQTDGWLWVVRSTFATNAVAGGTAAPAGAPAVNIGRNGAAGGHAWGGALASWSTGAVINSTFATNSVVGGNGAAGAAGQFTTGRGGAGGDAVGGAVHGKGLLGLTNITVAWNAVTQGIGGEGGIVPGPDGKAAGSGIAAEGGTVEVVNSIVVAAADVSTLNGGVVDAGYNLFSDHGSGRTVEGSVYSADPRFTEFKVWESLTTPGFLLQPGSPAIDAADPARAPSDDQRGLSRPGGLGPDMGAFETAASSFFIDGSVRRGDGKEGVPGVVVEIGDLKRTTDSEGRFRFGPLPTGFYTLAIAGGGVGYVPRLVQIPLVADATNVVFRTVDLVLTYQHGGAAGDDLVLRSSGFPNRGYRLEGSEDLRAWTTLETVVSDAQGRMEFRHAPGSASVVFFRIAEQ